MMHKTYLLLVILLVICWGCNNEQSYNSPVKKLSKAYIESPVSGKKYKQGEKIEAVIQLRNPEEKIDSIKILFNNQVIYTSTETKEKYPINISETQLPLGNYSLQYQLYIRGETETNKATLQLLAPHPPEKYTCNVIQSFPHSTQAYTQGFVIYKGIFYEGTGLKGKSQLKIIDIISGKDLKTHNLQAQYFGEGITILNDKIYQLTYQNKTCLVYDLNFTPVNSFTYDTEGWGLTHNGHELIMSDGTNRLFFINPETFTVNRTLEVYDDRIPRHMLNELEMINGKIWANVYQQNIILIINPDDGAVEAEIDCNGLLKDEEYTADTDVFNGIAYDSATNTIYVTGKNWPKIFKISIEKNL
jgi:glutamine cyclotransferase